MQFLGEKFTYHKHASKYFLLGVMSGNSENYFRARTSYHVLRSGVVVILLDSQPESGVLSLPRLPIQVILDVLQAVLQMGQSIVRRLEVAS